MFSQESSKTSPWEEINITAINWVLRWCFPDFSYILCSQANLEQLIDTDSNLVCIALYAPERGMTTDKFLLKQASGTLSKYLDPVQLEKINSDTTSPYDLTTEDLKQVILNAPRFGIENKKVVPLTKNIQYDQNNSSVIYAVFPIEGCHSLLPTFNKDNVSGQDVIPNLRKLIASYPVISINLTHLEQYPFCNHAFGILFVSSADFKPTGKEISDEGIKIIQECYNNKILIDIKHMSVGARRVFIEQIRTSPDFLPINQPLVCTHAGFTGLSYNDIPDYLTYQEKSSDGFGYVYWNKPKRFSSNTPIAYNPSSINLYDEEIIAILQSGGMIGISLDKRILGYSEPSNRPEAADDLAFEEEYISKQEKSYFLSRREIGSKMTEEYCITTQEVLEGGEVNPFVAYYHLDHFMSHILHLIYVADLNNYDKSMALQQVSIGSDFDGLINPIWCCPTSKDLPDFKKQFIREFPLFARANKDIVSLPENFDIHDFANKLFFENGKRFVLNRLGIINQF